MSFARLITKPRIETHNKDTLSLITVNNYCFCTAKLVPRTRLNGTSKADSHFIAKYITCALEFGKSAYCYIQNWNKTAFFCFWISENVGVAVCTFTDISVLSLSSSILSLYRCYPSTRQSFTNYTNLSL